MTTLNKKALVVLLRERLGKNAVIDPTDLETNKNDYQIKKKYLVTLFKINDKYIDPIIEEAITDWGSTIPLNEFINFLRYDATTLNNSKYTQGTYHIYMDYIHALYNIKCDNFNDKDKDQMGLPNYNSIRSDQTLYKAIFPARKEFTFAWWMMNISNKKYSKYINIQVEYQTRIEGKVFDIYFKNCNLIIEYQEAKANHTDVDTDKDKKAIIRGQGMIIEYFQESIYRENPEEYLINFWKNQLEKRIIQILIRNRKNNNFLDQYIFTKFTEIYVNLKKKLLKTKQTEYIKHRIFQLDNLLNGNNLIIKKIFSWKDISKNKTSDNEDMIISVDDIAELLNIKKNKSYIEETLKELVVGFKKDNKIYTNWNGLITFLLMVNSESIKIDPIIKRIVLDYLLSVQEIYENIMDELDSFQNNLITNIIDNSQRRENYIKKSINKKYEKDIVSLKQTTIEQNMIIEDLINNNKKVLKESSQIIESLDKIKDELENIISCNEELIENVIKNKRIHNKNLKNLSKYINVIDKNIDELSIYFDNINIIKPKQKYSIVESYIINKPIINNIPELVYTGDINNKIELIKLKSFFKISGIPSKVLKLLTSTLYPYIDNPKILSKLKLLNKNSNELNTEDANNEDVNNEDVNNEDVNNEDVNNEDVNNEDNNDEYSNEDNDNEESANEDTNYKKLDSSLSDNDEYQSDNDNFDIGI